MTGTRVARLPVTTDRDAGSPAACPATTALVRERGRARGVDNLSSVIKRGRTSGLCLGCYALTRSPLEVRLELSSADPLACVSALLTPWLVAHASASSATSSQPAWPSVQWDLPWNSLYFVIALESFGSGFLRDDCR